MSVYQIDTLAYEYGPQHGKEAEEIWQGVLPSNDLAGDIVNLETRCEVSNADSIRLVCMRNDNDLVTSLNQSLTQHINMPFNAANVWEEKVRDEAAK